MALKPIDLSHLAEPGCEFRLKVVPRAGRDNLELLSDGQVQIRVTAAPEDGKANRAVQKLLAKALGVAPSRLTLLRGASSREKLFRLD